MYSTLSCKDGDFEYTLPAVNGVGLPYLPAAIGDAERKFPEIIDTIINMQTRQDDILLATYQKCGTSSFIVNNYTKYKIDFPRKHLYRPQTI